MLQHGCLLAEERVIHPEHLPEEVLHGVVPEASPVPGAWGAGEVLPLAGIERRYLAWAAGRFRGDRADLARRLGLSACTLYRKLAQPGRGETPPDG